MPTIKQVNAFNNIVGNGGNVTKAMRDAKYTEATANTPQKLTESVGFKKLCEDNGLTDELLVKALTEDIKKKPQNRKAEIELGLKVIGRLKEETSKTNVLAFIFND